MFLCTIASAVLPSDTHCTMIRGHSAPYTALTAAVHCRVVTPVSLILNCTPVSCLPAGTIDCQVSVLNTGTVGLASFTLASTGNTVTGCTPSTPVLPGQNSSAMCEVHKSVLQSDFDAREGTPSTSLSVDVTLTSATSTTGLTVTHNAPVTLSGLQLPVTRAMTVATSLDKSAVSAAGKCSIAGFCSQQHVTGTVQGHACHGNAVVCNTMGSNHHGSPIC